MKIRIKGNTVRLRLTKTEVAEFCKNGYYSEDTNFGKAKFRYAVRSVTDLTTLNANFDGNQITIAIPASEVTNWERDDRVGFYHDMSLTNGEKLQIIVEKDFECLEDRGEDEGDNYPNPKAKLSGEYE